MFGTKLRTWMEAHIVRSKKKKERKKSEKGFDSTCNSPRSHSANRSPALHQVHPVNSPAKNVDGIRLQAGCYSNVSGSSGTSSATSSGTSATSSATSSGTSSGTSAGTCSVNLSSPESAYSTGYSTDGTSPGTSFPPEYYINIRTGTHYFQSNNNGRSAKRLTEAELVSAGSAPSTASTTSTASIASNGKLQNRLLPGSSGNMRQPIAQSHHPPNHPAGTPTKIAEASTNHGLRQQHNQQAQQNPPEPPPRADTTGHRRTGSYSAESSRSSLPVPSSIPPPLVSAPLQSPRERSRIRTNPWLSANSSGSGTGGIKSRVALDESSSSSGLKLTESSGSASDINVDPSKEARSRKEYKQDYRQESLSAGRSPINQNWRVTSGLELRTKIPLAVQRRTGTGGTGREDIRDNGRGMEPSRGGTGVSSTSSSSTGSSGSSGSSVTHSIRSSEDDITLNEMMGKFDESYVYEKETDILSDSDPTDCEDYVDSLSDLDTGQDAGDENDPLEKDDFDYIDNGSFLDLDNLECTGHFPNTGHCTYFTFTSELTRRSTRLRESVLRRRPKDDSVPQRTPSVRTNAKRQSTRHKKSEERQQSEKRKRRLSQRRKLSTENCDDETANLNRVLVERMLLKNSGFNQGSRSVGGTPICLRRKKHDINKNLSPLRLTDTRSILRPSMIESEIFKRRSNSVSYVNGNIVKQQVTGNAYMTTFASEIALIEADKEADKKYRELILEAENILVNMQKNQNTSPIVPSPSRKFHNGLANKRVELIKNTELNIELALSKSRNSQPELQSGSIKDLEHTSPKRQFGQAPCSPIRRFMDRNGQTPATASSSHESNKSPTSPILSKSNQHSPNSSLIRSASKVPLTCNGLLRADTESSPLYPHQITLTSKTYFGPPQRELSASATANLDSTIGKRDARAIIASREDGVTSSSSDSEERCDTGRRRPPLMTFRSVDMGPIKEASLYCPQSEPVKRKVYAGSATYGRIQKTLGEHLLRNSDGDTTTDDTDDSRRSLKEKMAQLRQERLAAEGGVSPQDSQVFQHQLAQLKRQMLMQTIEGLKRSLEDQSATLKQTCLKTVLSDDLP